MSTAFEVRALASTVRIELGDSVSAADQESIRGHWVDLAHDGPGEPDQVIRAGLHDASDWNGDPLVIRAESTTELAARITTRVTLEAIGGLRGEALMLHASAVALDDGRVIGFVGPSGRGKTTASQALSRTYGYVTDETLAIRADRSVVGYPKPLSIGTPADVKVTEPASALGLRTAPAEGLRLAAIVLLERQPGVEQPSVESVPIIEALEALVPQTSHLTALENPLRTLVETMYATGGVRRVVYSEAASLPSVVDELLHGFSLEEPALTAVAEMSTRGCDCYGGLLPVDAPPSSKVQSPGSHWRADYTDALMVDDALLLLVGGRVVALEGVGPILWLAADGSTEDELREIALRRLPDPPAGVDTAEVITGALQSLVDAGILVRD